MVDRTNERQNYIIIQNKIKFKKKIRIEKIRNKLKKSKIKKIKKKTLKKNHNNQKSFNSKIIKIKKKKGPYILFFFGA